MAHNSSNNGLFAKIFYILDQHLKLNKIVRIGRKIFFRKLVLPVYDFGGGVKNFLSGEIYAD